MSYQKIIKLANDFENKLKKRTTVRLDGVSFPPDNIRALERKLDNQFNTLQDFNREMLFEVVESGVKSQLSKLGHTFEVDEPQELYIEPTKEQIKSIFGDGFYEQFEEGNIDCTFVCHAVRVKPEERGDPNFYAQFQEVNF